MTVLAIPAILETILGSTLLRQFGMGVAASGVANAIFDEKRIVPALQAINTTLNRIDGALVDGFSGRDIELKRLVRAQEAAMDAAQQAQVDLLNAQASNPIGNSLGTRRDDISDASRRLEEATEAFGNLTVALHDRRAELVSGVSPVSGVGVGAVGDGAAGASSGTNACCCAHEQVMGA